MLKLELLTSEKLRILFDNEDMTRLDITYSALDYKNRKTRKIFWDAIGIAKKETGFDPSGAKLLIEAYPEKDGGLSLYVTKLGFSKNLEDDSDFVRGFDFNYETYIFSFACCDDLLDSRCLFLNKGLGIIDSSIYEYNRKYYLIFSIREPFNDKLIKNLLLSLSEYAQREDNDFTEAFLKEHANLISENTAIPKMLEGIKI